MTRYAFSIDLDRCIGCQACVVACKTGNELAAGDQYITIGESVRGQMPKLFGTFVHHRCLHCADAACVEVCPTGTLTKWNGLTVVDASKCSACGYCTDACPFQVPAIADNHVSKCVGCLDRVQDGETPWCALTCPSQAIRFGERDAIVAAAKTRLATIAPRYPNAQLYGEAALGGLGVVMLLLDQPAVYGLPENPTKPALVDLWQQVVQPASVGLSLTALVVTGVSFIIARRQHALEKAHAAAPVPTGAGKPAGDGKPAVEVPTAVTGPVPATAAPAPGTDSAPAADGKPAVAAPTAVTGPAPATAAPASGTDSAPTAKGKPPVGGTAPAAAPKPLAQAGKENHENGE